MSNLKTFGRALRGAAAAGAVSLALATSAVAADWTSFSGSYSVSLAGIPLGKVNLDATLNDGAYRLAGGGKISGVAQLFAQGKGRVSSVGKFSRNKPVPSRYDYSETSGGEDLAIGIALRNGNVTSASVVPPLDRMSERVPVTRSHKRGVVDPLSMLVLPVSNVQRALAGDACNRTIPVYDGRARFDIKLRHIGNETVSTDGYSGQAVICKVIFKAVSGHRKGRKEISEAESQADIRLWLAPIGETKVLGPYKLTAKTSVGTGVIKARRFQAKPLPKSAAVR
ncbi:MAG: DUF3108 domain-containing protein [Pseudomonadota bacterium]